jgi:transcriptional regulator with XRE-family HTH domain
VRTESIQPVPDGRILSSMEWPEAEVERVRDLLRTAVRDRGSIRDLEQSIGTADGSLRRVLNGQQKLTLTYLLLILEGLGMSWSEFFRKAFPEDGPERVLGPGERRRRREQEAGESPAPGDLDQAVLRALRELLDPESGRGETGHGK